MIFLYLERCAIPVEEACPIGKCSDAEFVFKFRSECSPSETGKGVPIVFLILKLQIINYEQPSLDCKLAKSKISLGNIMRIVLTANYV